jgi:hypothetical protein
MTIAQGGCLYEDRAALYHIWIRYPRMGSGAFGGCHLYRIRHLFTNSRSQQTSLNQVRTRWSLQPATSVTPSKIGAFLRTIIFSPGSYNPETYEAWKPMAPRSISSLRHSGVLRTNLLLKLRSKRRSTRSLRSRMLTPRPASYPTLNRMPHSQSE